MAFSFQELDIPFEYFPARSTYFVGHYAVKLGIYDTIGDFFKGIKGLKTYDSIYKKLGLKEIDLEENPIPFKELEQKKVFQGVPGAFIQLYMAKSLRTARDPEVLIYGSKVYHQKYHPYTPQKFKARSIIVPKKYVSKIKDALGTAEKVSSSIVWKKVPGMGDLGKGPCAPLGISIVLNRDVHEIINDLDTRYNKGKKPRRGRKATAADGATTFDEITSYMKDHGYVYIQFNKFRQNRDKAFSITTLINKGGLEIKRMLLYQTSGPTANHISAYVKGVYYDGWDSRRHRLIGVFVKPKDVQKVQKAVEASIKHIETTQEKKWEREKRAWNKRVQEINEQRKARGLGPSNHQILNTISKLLKFSTAGY